jgi:hypothetical protein
LLLQLACRARIPASRGEVTGMPEPKVGDSRGVMPVFCPQFGS